MGDLKELEVKTWKETATYARTWRDLAERANPQRVVVQNDVYDYTKKEFVYFAVRAKSLNIIRVNSVVK
jgi:hypothetical protein